MSAADDKLEPVADRLEPGNYGASPEHGALLSIAISLKRLADLMEATCGEDSRNAYGELPFEAIGGGIARSLRGA
jgi:hypothetical protein